MSKPTIYHDVKQGWCCRIICDGLPRTFHGFSSAAAADKAAELQMRQWVTAGQCYTQRELQQLGLCGEPGSYEATLSKRREKFGVVLEDGSIKRL